MKSVDWSRWPKAPTGAWRVRKISEEDRGEATETGGNLGVGRLGAEEEERPAVPHAQRSGRRMTENEPQVGARCGGHCVSWSRAVSAAHGVKPAWK